MLNLFSRFRIHTLAPLLRRALVEGAEGHGRKALCGHFPRSFAHWSSHVIALQKQSSSAAGTSRLHALTRAFASASSSAGENSPHNTEISFQAFLATFADLKLGQH